MLLYGVCSKKLDCVKLSSKQHTAIFLLGEVNKTVAELAFEWDKIKATVTDSPSVMLKLRRIFKEANPHVIVLACTRHAANTLAKDMCKTKPVRNFINSNCKIVNFFTSSHAWFTWSKEWFKENAGHHYSLDDICKTR